MNVGGAGFNSRRLDRSVLVEAPGVEGGRKRLKTSEILRNKASGGGAGEVWQGQTMSWRMILLQV